MTAEVHEEPDRSRFAARVEGRLAGFAAYELTDGVITFTHTVVGDDFEGQGVGNALARTGLDAARERGLVVVPRCSFIAGWIDRHPDYADLVLDA
jgi:predicted GNAT family acetyltransferase